MKDAEIATRQMITGMLYSGILSQTTRRHALSGEGAQDNFVVFRKAVEELKKLKDKSEGGISASSGAVTLPAPRSPFVPG